MTVYAGTLKKLKEVVFHLDDNQEYRAPECRTVYVKFEQEDGNALIFRILDSDYLSLVRPAVLNEK